MLVWYRMQSYRRRKMNHPYGGAWLMPRKKVEYFQQLKIDSSKQTPFDFQVLEKGLPTQDFPSDLRFYTASVDCEYPSRTPSLNLIHQTIPAHH